ncbi:MAG: hypothetical protein ACJATG_002626, partial [Dinoroseobacter sp.]
LDVRAHQIAVSASVCCVLLRVIRSKQACFAAKIMA